MGKNMTAFKVNKEAIILDMGLHIENYIICKGEEDVHKVTASELLRADAIPDDRPIKNWIDYVKLIVPTHAHLDHVGAIPFLSNKYTAPILCTPFTAEVLKAIINDEKFNLKNQIKVLLPNSSFKVSDKITIEFINVTLPMT